MLLAKLRQIVGDQHVAESGSELIPYVKDPRGDFDSATQALVFPKSTEEVAGIVIECGNLGVSIVPQGGNTGLCGGAISVPGQIILNLRRMNQILEIDSINDTLSVEAGCILSNIQKAAAESKRYFPLSLGSEGSCQIGGNLSTNAGGINVLRYGNVRDQVLGLEAVLANGSIWNGMSELRKDNTGYDLRHLLIGSEGTLGIITKAVLRLFPQPKQVETAFVSLSNLEASLELLANARADSGGTLSSFELIPGLGITLANRHISGCRNPLGNNHEWSVILVYSTSSIDHNLRETLESTLAHAMEAGIVTDGVISQSNGQTEQIWALREGLREAQTMEGIAFTHDVSVKVSLVPTLIKRATSAATYLLPDIRVYPFGHVGDGNIHLSFLQPDNMNADEFKPWKPEFNAMVFELVDKLGGSFSAEHGVGLLRLNEMKQYKNSIGLAMMKEIKTALDPRGVLNPGKVVPS